MDQQELAEILTELKIASKIDRTKAMRDYDMLFLGGDVIQISAVELHHSLTTVQKKQVSVEEILKLVPVACGRLGMEIVAMKNVGDRENKLADYTITLG